MATKPLTQTTGRRKEAVARARLRSDRRGARAHDRLGRTTDRADDPIGRFDDELELRGRIEDVSAALAELPAADRELLGLRVGDGLTYDEIAAELGVPVNTVRTRIFRAREKLRELLVPSGQDLSEAPRAPDVPEVPDAPHTPDGPPGPGAEES